MRQQFFYTRNETVNRVDASTGEQKAVQIPRKDSFNLDKVVRTIEMHDGTVLVLLNDIHERTTETPNISPKSNKVTGVIRKRDTYQSEIYLSPEDGERFYRQTAVEYIPERTFDEVIETINSDGDQKTTGA